MNSIIETKDLKLWYGDHQVLKGITMDIPEHQLHAGKHGIHGGKGFAADGIQMQQPGRVRFAERFQTRSRFKGPRDRGHDR